MKIGIGLPNTVPGTDGGEMREWAIRAEAAGFSTLGTIDRLVYGNHESLIALSYAAAVTERVGLLTSMLLSPLRSNNALLAKQAGSLHKLSGGRLTLGLAVGGREDDFEVSGIDFHKRGALFDRQLEDLRRFWDDGTVGFPGPPVVIGGRSDATFRRAAQWDGWMMGGGAPDAFPPEIVKLDAAWAEAARDGQPRKMSLAYFALGDNARAQASGYIEDYYAFLGPEAAAGFGASIPADPDTIKGVVDAFAAAGCDELVWFPTASDPAQVDLLAEVVLQRGIRPQTPNSGCMHPELRRARALYHEWRLLPQREMARLAPFAREVKDLALDLRGHADSAAAEHELADANDALDLMLRDSALRAAQPPAA